MRRMENEGSSPSFLVRELNKISRLNLAGHHDVCYDGRHLAAALERAKLCRREKVEALQRLARIK